MTQGSFNFPTSGNPTITDTSSNFAYLGGTFFDGSNANPAGSSADWTQVVTNYSGTEPAPTETHTYASAWTISGTGGSGKIFQIQFYRGPGGGRHVIVTLAADGGNLAQNRAPFTFQPPQQSQPACFVSGTRILTQNGYKAIETLQKEDLVVLADGRQVPYRLKRQVFENTTERSAPYRIEAGAFGPAKPAADICLSPIHKLQIRKSVWISPQQAAALKNPKVRQYGIGESVTYWHIECADFLRDNLVCEGMVVESLGTRNNYRGPAKVYTWNERLGGFTRPGSVAATPRFRSADS